MSLQLWFRCCIVFAHFTVERFFARVRSSMILHIVRIPEDSFAKVARVGLVHAGMLFHVFNERWFTTVNLTTFCTLHRSLLAVRLLMSFQQIFVFKPEIYKSSLLVLSLILICWYKELLLIIIMAWVTYVLGQTSHLNGRMSKCITEWACNELLSMKSLPQFSQTYGWEG